MEKYGFLSLNYPCYSFLSGALTKRYVKLLSKEKKKKYEKTSQNFNQTSPPYLGLCGDYISQVYWNTCLTWKYFSHDEMGMYFNDSSALDKKGNRDNL